MSSLNIDDFGLMHSNEGIKRLVCLVDSYVHKNARTEYKYKHQFKYFSEFETYFINELIRIINEKGLYEFDIQTFPWEEVGTVFVDDFLIDFKTNQKNNIHLKIFLLEENRARILDQISIHCEYRYYIERQYTTKISCFTKSKSPHNIKQLDTLICYINNNYSSIYKDDFKIVTPKIKQEVIDSFPRYYDYKLACFFSHSVDILDPYGSMEWESLTIRLRILDNGNQTITIKCYEDDIYNFALETINLGLKKYCYINPITDSLYSFHFIYENLLIDFDWIQNKKLPLKVDFIYNEKQCSINRKIKSINSPKFLSQYIKEDYEMNRKYINGYVFDENTILVEFE